MRDGLAAREATGTELMRPHLLALLADALGKVHQPEEGLRMLEEAIAVADRNNEQSYQAELYRLRGELLLMQSTRRAVSHSATRGKSVARAAPPALGIAESCFKQSIKIARRQNAKSLELRAVMSMARLCQSQGRQNEAREPLAQIYGNFTEGFATKDLREAKALLEALS
jgi:predicted ATPase